MLGAIVVAVVVALWFYLSGGRYVSTENSSLMAGQAMVSSSVNGKVIAINVHENETVAKGQILFQIDPASYRADVAVAQAQLAAALAGVNEQRADYQQSLSESRSAQARLAFAQSEAARQQSLLKEGISSRAQYDMAVLAVRTATDEIAAAKAKSESVLAKLGSSTAQLNPEVRRAAAALDRAQISLDSTVIKAPQDGIVTRVNQLQLGNYVTATRPVFMLSGRQFWVEANFKESQLRYMRLGQPATIKIDAFPDVELKGHVKSFSPGTGNTFSVLPPENATGNWVKVTQRLPVEIALDSIPADLPLHAGLSVEVTVDTGHKRNLFGADTPPIAPRAAVASPRQ
jgi:membrane fusion protein (multidrug efflux system)